MSWSNEALQEERKWFKAIKLIHQEMQKELASSLAGLPVDSDGVLSRKVKASAILFSDKKFKEKTKKVAEKLIEEAIQRFGERAMKEAKKEKK